MDALIADLDRILGKDRVQKLIVVGVGNIGRALLNYSGFEKNGIRILAGFDTDPARQAPEAAIPVFPMEAAKDFITHHGVRFAILCVPSLAAPQVAEILIAAGIRGLLNFAPIRLKEREGCVLENIDLVTELEHIVYFVNARAQSEGA